MWKDELMKTVQTKREREKRMVNEMINLYCKKPHPTKGKELCSECEELNEYAKIAQWQVSVYGDKNILFQLQSTLL